MLLTQSSWVVVSSHCYIHSEKHAFLCWDPKKRKKEEIKKLGQGNVWFLMEPISGGALRWKDLQTHPLFFPQLFSCPTTSFPILRVLGEVSVISPPQNPSPTWPCSPIIHIHPALRGPLNPEETCSYFLSGNFDLQEFCFSGQHLPRGMYPDKDGSLTFIL